MPKHDGWRIILRTAASEAAVHAVITAKQAIPNDAADFELYADAAARIIATYRLRIARYAREDALAAQASEPTQHGDTDRAEHELRLIGLRAEREEIVRFGRSQGTKQLILRKIGREIDLAEARYSI